MKQNNALVYEVKLKKFLKVTLLGLIITLMFNIISPRHFMSDAVAENDFFNLSDGTYDLVEWEQDGFSYKNPDVSGRMMWVDKKILVVLNKKFDPKEYFIYQGVGDYLIKGSQFGYRYTNSAAFYGDETEIYKGDPTAAYGGGEYRWFNYKIKKDGIYMISESGDQEMIILTDGTFIYKDSKDLSGNQIIRIWKKVD